MFFKDGQTEKIVIKDRRMVEIGFLNSSCTIPKSNWFFLAVEN